MMHLVSLARRSAPTGTRRAAFLGTCLWLALTASPALAFKWYECPAPPLPLHPSTLGATDSPFVHPGRALTIVLNEAQVASTGGFATAGGASRVRVTFESLFGSPIVLPDRQVTATSASSLTFPFPDAHAIVGRPLAGPVSIQVFRPDGKKVAHIAGSDFVALPADNDGAAIVDHGQPALGALAADGDLWVPVHFAGEWMPMPGCEGDFVMKHPVRINRARVVGMAKGQDELLDHSPQLAGYLGAMTINGHDFYGMRMPERLRAVKPSGGEARAVDRMNDAEYLVIRVAGRGVWSRKASPLAAATANSTPVQIMLSWED